MRKQGHYLKRNFIRNFSRDKARAQASIEFSLGLVTAVLFLFLTCNFFIWCGRNIVQRQIAYESSRKNAASNTNPGQLDFYNQTTSNPINLFVSGGKK
jgi:uncharacterized protein (UPF0333 family)